MTPEESINAVAGLLTAIIILGPILGFAYFIAWILTVIHCATKCPEKDRMPWLLITIFIPLVGFVLYWTIAPKAPKPQKIPTYPNVGY